MLTHCPECATTFRVTPEQLKMRSGRVRCGACRTVFNALETLAEEAAAPSVEPTATPPRAAIAEDGAEWLPAAEAAEQAADDKAGGAALAEEAAALHEKALVIGSADAEIADVASDAGAVADAAVAEEIPDASGTRQAAAADEETTATAPLAEQPAAVDAHRRAEAPRRPRTWPWALGAVAASLVLAVQALLHFRTELAVLHPEARPLLASACEALGCTLWRPRKPELVGIETSNLSVADGRLALTATLRNRAPFAQEYPHLELTLTDTGDRALARRVLAPTEYLPPQTPFSAGFGARAEVAVSLAVATRDLAAAGYRLYLFYP